MPKTKKIEAEETAGAEAEVAAEPPKFATLDITCRFCGEKGGEVQVPLAKIPEGEEPTLAHAGVEEHRCPTCVEAHGTLQEAKKAYDELIGEDDERFKVWYAEAGHDLGRLVEKCDEKLKADEAEREKIRRELEMDKEPA